MPKTTFAESDDNRPNRYQERLRVRTAAITAISLDLTEATDVVAACSMARRMAARLCFEAAEADRLAEALAAAGGAAVGVGGRGSAMVSDASEPEHVVLRVSLEVRVVGFALVEAAVLRVAGPWRDRPALGLPLGVFCWSAEPGSPGQGSRVVFTLARRRGKSGADSPFTSSPE